MTTKKELEEELKKLKKQLDETTGEKQKEIIEREISRLTEDSINYADLAQKDLIGFIGGNVLEIFDTDEGLIDIAKKRLEEAQEKAANKAYRKFTNFLLTREKLYFAKVVTKDDKVYFRIDKTFDAMGAETSGLSLDRADAEFAKIIQENMQENLATNFDRKEFDALEKVGFGFYNARGRTYQDLNGYDQAKFRVNLKRALGVRDPDAKLRDGKSLDLSAENVRWENYPYLTPEQQNKIKNGTITADQAKQIVLDAPITRENARRKQQRKAKSTTNPLATEQEGSYYIPWFFLGDLIEFASKEAFENFYNPDREKNSKNNNFQFNEDFVKRTKVLLGPVEYKKENGSPADVPISLAEMPVSFEFFKKWWKTNVVDQKKRTYSLANFIQACMREFMIEKFYLEPSDCKCASTHLVPKWQVVDLP